MRGSRYRNGATAGRRALAMVGVLSFAAGLALGASIGAGWVLAVVVLAIGIGAGAGLAGRGG